MTEIEWNEWPDREDESVRWRRAGDLASSTESAREVPEPASARLTPGPARRGSDLRAENPSN